MNAGVELHFADGTQFNVDSVTSCSWGVTMSGSNGSPQGTATFGDFVFTTQSSDQTTPVLEEICATGSQLAKVVAVVADPATGKGVEWTMTTAFLSSFQTAGDASQAMTVDSVAVSFQTISAAPF